MRDAEIEEASRVEYTVEHKEAEEDKEVLD
jgi:hypothetical protein